jgi:hypothetical protein
MLSYSFNLISFSIKNIFNIETLKKIYNPYHLFQLASF